MEKRSVAAAIAASGFDGSIWTVNAALLDGRWLSGESEVGRRGPVSLGRPVPGRLKR
ncbi:hypothetical protein GCM10022232_94240 [Streptomyces plumbiresistens]|uniref:Uncharacterized protein n=1 Tax=Streptomyces plumbiresistens TaxID=511811 RepID=A0ABP7U038_9ACTN